jgi:hypothetical protein
MLKTALMVVCAMVFFNLTTVRADDSEDAGEAEEVAVVEPIPEPSPSASPVLAPALVETGTQNDDMQSCLYSIYSGRRESNDDVDAGDIVVTGSRFGIDFHTSSFVNSTSGGARSFFLTSNGLFGPGTSFQIFDTDGDGTQWKCSSAQRLRRLNTDDDSEFDDNDTDDTESADRVAADMRQTDQWGGGLNSTDGQRESIYYVKAGVKTFRVNCGVGSRSLGIGAHRNRFCSARAVRTVEGPQENVKVCQNSDNTDLEFIKKALRRREKYLRNNTPVTRERWERVRDQYAEIRRTCTALVTSDHSAKDALKDLGKEINERISRFNRGGGVAVQRVEIP